MDAHNFDLTRRDTFEDFAPVVIRFSDQDSMGHVNNVSIAAYIEAGRTMLLESFLNQFDHPGLDYILARVAIDYRRELNYPGSVDVGARVIRLGSKSLTAGYGVFQGDICYATAECVNVFYDMNTRRSVLPPKDVQQAIQQKVMAGS